MMKNLRLVVVKGFLAGVIGVFSGAPAVFAQEACPVPDGVTPAALPSVTARDVEAGTGSLQDFALGAVEYSTRVSGDAAEAAYVACLTRLEGGPFRSGSIYIISLTPDGRVFFNAKNMATGGRQLDPLIYGAILSAVGIDVTNPANIPSQLLNVAATGMFPDPDGGPVPGIGGYAVGYFSISFSAPLISLVGFDLQEAHLVTEEIDYGDPEITAAQVVDRKTLKRFVTNAANFMSELTGSGDFSAIAKIRIAFRDPNGPWRHGPVYLFVLDRTGYTIFHGAFPDKFELNTPTTTLRDAVTGELILPQIITAATGSPEGGFVRYHFDNPDDDTDSAEIPKVTYAREATFRVPGTDGTTIEARFIVGAGIYGDPVSNDFAHFANGGSITSDLVFVNVAPQPSRPAIYFYDTEGALVPAELVVDVAGDLVVQEDGSLTIRTEMEPLGELTISTHGQGEVVSGSLKLVSRVPSAGCCALISPASARPWWEPADLSTTPSSRCAAGREESTRGSRSTTGKRNRWG